MFISRLSHFLYDFFFCFHSKDLWNLSICNKASLRILVDKKKWGKQSKRTKIKFCKLNKLMFECSRSLKIWFWLQSTLRKLQHFRSFKSLAPFLESLLFENKFKKEQNKRKTTHVCVCVLFSLERRRGRNKWRKNRFI